MGDAEQRQRGRHSGDTEALGEIMDEGCVGDGFCCCTSRQKTIRPRLRHLLDTDQGCSERELLGVEHAFSRGLYYCGKEAEIVAIPFDENALDWSEDKTLQEDVECSYAAVQLLGVEQFAWIKPELTPEHWPP